MKAAWMGIIVATGVNWGYSASQLADNIDPATVLTIAARFIADYFYRLSHYLQCISDFCSQRYSILWAAENNWYNAAPADADDPSAGNHPEPDGDSFGISGWMAGRCCLNTDHYRPTGWNCEYGLCATAYLCVSALFALCLRYSFPCRRPGKMAA